MNYLAEQKKEAREKTTRSVLIVVAAALLVFVCITASCLLYAIIAGVTL